MQTILKTGWVTWKELEPYRQQLQDMLHESTTKFHYPTWNISRSFAAQTVDKLQTYLNDHQAYMWCAFEDGKLVGFCWGYISTFINRKRWNIAALFMTENHRHQGLGRQAMKAAEQKARELDCDDMAVMHAAWNKPAENLYQQLGFDATRVERVKSLQDLNEDKP